MKKTFLKIAPIAMLALAACNNSETAADGEATPAEEEKAEVQLPPSIVANDVYRCGDGTVLYIDFLGREGKEGTKVAADIRVGEASAEAIRVSAPVAEEAAAPAEGEETAPDAKAETEEAAPAGPMKSEDGEASLSGEGAQVNVKLPGKGAQTCKA